jgi:hypothetical protein
MIEWPQGDSNQCFSLERDSLVCSILSRHSRRALVAYVPDKLIACSGLLADLGAHFDNMLTGETGEVAATTAGRSMALGRALASLPVALRVRTA